LLPSQSITAQKAQVAANPQSSNLSLGQKSPAVPNRDAKPAANQNERMNVSIAVACHLYQRQQVVVWGPALGNSVIGA
jgi:hypothetical protein